MEKFPSKYWRNSLLSAGILALTITFWVLFAPVQFGGGASYVILSGNSMAPDFLTGDLVVVRSEQAYNKGDAVAYRHPEIGHVFHRIIGFHEDGRFLLKGDHNDWIDAYTPSEEDIVGKLWIHIPGIEKTLLALRSPWAFAILVLVFSLLSLRFLFPSDKKHQNRGKRMTRENNYIGEKILGFGVLLFLALVLGIFAFQRPLLRTVEVPLSYQQQAVYRYTAEVPEGIYDSDEVQPGEPIFRQLNGSFAVSMDYIFLSTHPAEISGTYQLLARVQDGSGWKRTLALSPKTEFADKVFTVGGTLNLQEIQDFIDTLEDETGVQRSQYTLTILNEIEISGSLDELTLEESFLPTLEFQINALEVQLRQSSDGANSLLMPSKEGVLTKTIWEQNKISILGFSLPVSLARSLALVAGLSAALSLLLLFQRVYRSSQENEFERLRLWYGPLLVEARNPQLLEQHNYIDVTSLDDLATLAEKDQRVILHLAEEEERHFFVQTNEQLYHYAFREKQRSTELIANQRPRRWQLPKIRRENGLQNAYEHALKGWAKAVDIRLSMEGQADRIAEMAYELAHALNIDGKELEDIRLAAHLHKIGLMNIPDKIVAKKNKLTKKELEILRNHPKYAREHLGSGQLLKPIAEAIYYQHERWDGSGQPEGLQGEEIPLGSRIIAIVNVWNGLQQKRPYREAWTTEEIFDYFREQAGQQFDPNITNVFLEMKGSESPQVIEAHVLVKE
jgi:signal peptidase I